MADEKLVEREMLTASFVNGTDVKFGDVVHLTEAQAKAWENLDPPACAEVGTIEKQRQAHREYEEELAEREAKVREHREEQARIRGLNAQGLSAEQVFRNATDTTGEASGEDGPKVPTGEPKVGSDNDGDDDKPDPKPSRPAGRPSSARR